MSADRNLTEQDFELLSAYLDGALSYTERTALEVRLAAEDNLRQELEALRQTVALVKGVPRLRAPRNYTLSADMVRPPRWIIFPTTTAFSALSAAAAMILIFIGATLFLSQSSQAMFNAVPSNFQGDQDTQSQIAAQPTMSATILLEQAEQTDGILLASALPPSSAGEDSFSPDTSATSALTATAPDDFTMQYFASVTPTQLADLLQFAPQAPQATQPAPAEAEELDTANGATEQESPADESESEEAANAAGAAMADTAAQVPTETASTEREAAPATLSSTITAQPTATASHTPTSSATPTTAPTLPPAPTLEPVRPTSTGSDLLAPGLVLLGLILLTIAIVTTWIRTRR